MDVFVACHGDKNYNFFFHLEHVIYSISWGWYASKEKPARTNVLHELKLWHAYYYNVTLDAQLYDITDVEAWFGRL